jgi:hypothetical protein
MPRCQRSRSIGPLWLGSDMQRPSISAEHAVMHHFAERGMREYGVHEVRLDQLGLLAAV